jgi:hypothetical protein
MVDVQAKMIRGSARVEVMSTAVLLRVAWPPHTGTVGPGIGGTRYLQNALTPWSTGADRAAASFGVASAT